MDRPAMVSKFEIELDMVLDETRNKMGRVCVQGKPREEIEAHGLASVVMAESGPGGGNPLVRLSGSRVNIEAYLREVYCQDAEDAEYFSTMIRPYSGRVEGTLSSRA